ncbi:MAG TPA: isochorismate synthase [Geminocystis sp. M7585_C2015_104]|nr:isochorismate synthase [Geminocystis sp. M7585_C2015_104]
MATIPESKSSFSLLDKLQEFKKLIFTNPPNSNFPLWTLSQEVPPIDPLVFFSLFRESGQECFYWENPNKQEAIVAIGTVKSLTISSINSGQLTRDRFSLCQDFFENNCFPYFSGINPSPILPYFLAYFTFFSTCSLDSFPVASIYIPRLLLTKRHSHYSVSLFSEYQVNNYSIFLDFFQQEIPDFYSLFPVGEKRSRITIEDNNPQEFLEKVNRSLEAIRECKLKKIVVAHGLELKIRGRFNLIRAIDNLRINHPECYIFALGNKNNEYFIGASPERILSIRGNNLMSDALAGSAPRGKTPDEDYRLGIELLNSEKDRREHQAVSDFIFEQLKSLGLRPKKEPLQLLKLSNIQHLWTPISAQIERKIKPLEILGKLHPTPAVAGEPIDVACQEIWEKEKLERTLYAAPIGWLDGEGNCDFIVGIRSALIRQNSARLYAGAGIVKGSNPQQELMEIRLKFQALLQALIAS